jgi:hypothetical protein
LPDNLSNRSKAQGIREEQEQTVSKFLLALANGEGGLHVMVSDGVTTIKVANGMFAVSVQCKPQTE